ncbi:MAG: choline-sulfatase [Planctomycetota bacterium]|jgi:choline-sulfatase
MMNLDEPSKLEGIPTHWGFFLRLVATFLGVVLLAIWDLSILVSGARVFPESGALLALAGFAAILSVVLGLTWTLCESLLSCADQKPASSKLSSAGLRLVATIPPALPLALLSMTLFKGGKAKAFDLGGLGPVLVFLLFYFVLRLGIKFWRRHISKRQFVSVIVLFPLVWGCHYCDQKYYVGLYDAIHEALGLASIVFAALLVFRFLELFSKPRFSLPVTLFAVSFFLLGSYVHFASLFDAAPSSRIFLFQDLTSSRILIRRVPYPRQHEEVVQPLELSSRFQKWNSAREKARSRIPALSGGKPLNLFIISVDAVRRDHTTLHGYERKTTPFLAEFAKKCVVFEDARSPSTSSFFSLMSILSGSYPSSISLRRGRDPDLLGQSLKDSGYSSLGLYTDAIFTARPEGWPKPDIRLGMDRHEYTALESKGLVPRLLDSMSKMGERFFLLTHLMDPHYPYAVHPEFDFGKEAIERYDSELAFTDSQLRILIDGMEKQGLLENTVVVITSDHGEAFGEHGAYLHGGSPFEELCRVPLMMYLPFMRKGRRILGSVGLTSLGPTLVDIMGSRELRECESPSLLPLILGESEAAEYYAVVERPSILDRSNFPPVTAIVQGKYKYRVQYNADLKLLYDIEKDPLEHRELSAKDPEQYQRMAELYREWQGDCLIQRDEQMSSNLEFATLRNEILLGRDDLLKDLFLHLNSEFGDVRKDAARLLFDLEVGGRMTHDAGLCRADVTSEEPHFLALRDLLRARVQHRPFHDGDLLVISDSPQDRKRAALTLWHLFKLPFAAETAQERLLVEKDKFVRAELYGVLARAGKEIDTSMVFDLAVEVGGDLGTRMVFGMMGRDDAIINAKIKNILFREDSPLSHTIIENLGAIDNEFRRDLLVRILRQNHFFLRVSAVNGVGNFPKSDWHEDLLCQLVKHERHQRLRVECANHLNYYPSEKASQAILDAFAAFPNSAFGIGYILSSFRKTALDNWDAKEVDVTAEHFFGKSIDLDFDMTSPDKRHARRLFVTVVRQSKPESKDDVLKIVDADGQVLLSQKCKIPVEFFYLDLDLTRKPYKAPLSILLESPSRTKGERVGFIISFMVPRVAMASLWPSDAPTMNRVGILQRFSKGWVTTMEHPNSCFLSTEQGSMFLMGAREKRDEVSVEITTPALPCDLEISLRGSVIGTFKLEGGNKKRKLNMLGIGKHYKSQATNRLTFRILKKSPGTSSPQQGAASDLALHSVVFN